MLAKDLAELLLENPEDDVSVCQSIGLKGTVTTELVIHRDIFKRGCKVKYNWIEEK